MHHSANSGIHYLMQDSRGNVLKAIFYSLYIILMVKFLNGKLLMNNLNIH